MKKLGTYLGELYHPRDMINCSYVVCVFCAHYNRGYKTLFLIITSLSFSFLPPLHNSSSHSLSHSQNSAHIHSFIHSPTFVFQAIFIFPPASPPLAHFSLSRSTSPFYNHHTNVLGIHTNTLLIAAAALITTSKAECIVVYHTPLLFPVSSTRTVRTDTRASEK